jgi:diguanylate cyclase (GGDEF)-like protein/PAS domain S-box-containing protein
MIGMESLHRALFEAAADAILVVDEGGAIVLANAACGALFGCDPAELVGAPLESLVPARVEEHVRQRSNYLRDPGPRAMGGGLALFARRLDGSEVPVDISLSPLVVGGRRLVSCSIRDQRGRTHGLDHLRVQAKALRSAANGVVITDDTGTITWVNPAATAMTGYASDELLGKHTRILKSGEHGPELYSDLWRTVRRGETWSGTMVNRRKDGSLYHEEQTIAPVTDDAGRVTHFIAIKRDVSAERRTQEALARAHEELAARLTEIESLNRRLRDQAIRDPLTGLHNRRYLDDALDHAVARGARSGEPLSVAALDLDRFKDINDNHGHAAGDRVLLRAAEVLRSSVRASDILGRVGGEEFIVALPGAALGLAVARAEQWRTALASGSVANDDGTRIHCTVSIGVAEHRRGDETIAEALRRADAALYEAKRGGRDRVVAATPPAAADWRFPG